MKYPTAGNKPGRIFSPTNFQLCFDDGKSRFLRKWEDSFLPYQTVFNADVASEYHVTFVVPDMKDFEEYDEMIITFIPFDGKTKSLTLKATDRNPEQMFFDPSVWVEV